ncbi:SDR family oxidoreductase [Aeromicrobium sp. CFBP 8757]|uniref:SDR family NAD(P)-dependent oxidoreductase n=1 Tax=Aeromicrobium sp. CFBP 8757 TaxID=2775288 RepID=UPI00177B6B9B|nr:SDR family oxidoreductase [Aeromicrobium sp. CFBP 8757]
MSGSGRLAGRRAIVTGSTSGIGAAIAGRFAAEGASVVLTGRRAAEGERTAATIRAAGGDARFLAGDATDEEFVQSLVRFTREQCGGLDILVNNAGIAPAGPLEQMSRQSWDEVVACNLTSMFLVSKHAIADLRASDHASIITLGSTFGVVGAAGSVAYAMTKAAAISFSRSLALELAPDGVRVNALCPGATRTEFLETWAEATGDREATMGWLLDRHPLGRLGTVDEQADAALFLASDESSFVTGHALMVDGGYTAQ